MTCSLLYRCWRALPRSQSLGTPSGTSWTTWAVSAVLASHQWRCGSPAENYARILSDCLALHTCLTICVFCVRRAGWRPRLGGQGDGVPALRRASQHVSVPFSLPSFSPLLLPLHHKDGCSVILILMCRDVIYLLHLSLSPRRRHHIRWITLWEEYNLLKVRNNTYVSLRKFKTSFTCSLTEQVTTTP